MARALFSEEHDMFRDSFRAFVEKELVPHSDEWERAGIVPREAWLAAGAQGFIGTQVPEEYGGPGVDDFRFNVIVGEELSRAGASGLGLTLQNDVALPYFLDLTTEEQKRRWLPGIVSGETVTAIAMTEPGAGSDLAGIRTTARREGDEYVVNGAKTFITNGIHADVVITVVKTDPSKKHKGMSLLLIERGMPGFDRGRNLDKIGLHAQDTAELSFTDVRVPVTNLLGNEGEGFLGLVHNLPQERLSIAVGAVATAERAIEVTLEYVRERTAFGQPIGSFQHSRFLLAELHTETTIARTFVDECIAEHLRGELSAERAAMAKWWATELQCKVVDRCVQLHGGYGYMSEYPIAKMYLDSRIQTIYGGTTEIMKEIIGRSLGL